MQNKLILSLTALSLAVVALAGCTAMGSGSGGGSAGGGSAGGSGYGGLSSPSTAAMAGDLATSGSSLGSIMVNGKGMTVYVFDKDTANSGTSACTGACLANWPAVTTTATKPHVTGISGTIATIKDPDGKTQITVDGLPLYTFAGDAAKGDTKGQGLQNVWWVVSPSGKKITAAATGTGY